MVYLIAAETPALRRYFLRNITPRSNILTKISLAACFREFFPADCPAARKILSQAFTAECEAVRRAFYGRKTIVEIPYYNL